MKTYRFIYNNNDSRYQYKCDADAMMEARNELKMLKRYDKNVKVVHIWEEKPNGKFRYVASYE